MPNWCLDFAERAERDLATWHQQRSLELVEAKLPTVRLTMMTSEKKADSVRPMALDIGLPEFLLPMHARSTDRGTVAAQTTSLAPSSRAQVKAPLSRSR